MKNLKVRLIRDQILIKPNKVSEKKIGHIILKENKMKQHLFTATCDICGIEGSCTASTSAASWRTNSCIVHKNPRICKENLKQKEKK